MCVCISLPQSNTEIRFMSVTRAIALWVSWPGNAIKAVQVQTETLQNVRIAVRTRIRLFLLSGVMERNTGDAFWSFCHLGGWRINNQVLVRCLWSSETLPSIFLRALMFPQSEHTWLPSWELGSTSNSWFLKSFHKTELSAVKHFHA